jgi:arylsulfatase A
VKKWAGAGIAVPKLKARTSPLVAASVVTLFWLPWHYYLYAFIDGDSIPVPPTGELDKTPLPNHPYADDNRPGLIAPDFDIQEVDQLFLRKSVAFMEEHVRCSPDRPFFLYHPTNAVHLPSFASSTCREKTDAGPHGDFIFEFDQVVGELLNTLDQLGIADNTLIMVSSDNGPEVTSVVHMRKDYQHDGARPWRGMKRDQWEGGYRIPFIARWPGHILPNTQTDQTVCLCDIMATCAALVGADLPRDGTEDSYNILPVLLGERLEGQSIREHTLHQTISLALSIRKEPWKYLDHRGSGGNDYEKDEALPPYVLPEKAPDAPGQLYNPEHDRGETTNLYFKHSRIVEELRTQLHAYRDSGRSRPWSNTPRPWKCFRGREKQFQLFHWKIYSKGPWKRTTPQLGDMFSKCEG